MSSNSVIVPPAPVAASRLKGYPREGRDIAFSVEGLSKAYTISHGGVRASTAAEVIVNKIKNPFQRNDTETFWALSDVSFELYRGDVVGVIGRNGAGKSTLLKMLSRITEPTRGTARLHGRVGSLLEVGTGFHPELTGRENIFLNGSILGMMRREIDRHFDAIVEFSGTEKFLDTPVKRYSSGMYVRLAFAVAAHLDTEILIIDEVLAVGDAEFQKKCLGKMQDVAKSGRTILYVSHMMGSVQQLCNRCIFLAQGKVMADGPTSEVLPYYIQSGQSGDAEQKWEAINAPGDDAVRLMAVRVVDGADNVTGDVNIADPFAIEVDFSVLKEEGRFNVTLDLYNEYNVCVFSASNMADPRLNRMRYPAGLHRSRCEIPGHLLNNGQYRVTVKIMEDVNTTIISVEEKDVVAVEVHDDLSGRGDFTGNITGILRPDFSWSTARLAGSLK